MLMIHQNIRMFFTNQTCFHFFSLLKKSNFENMSLEQQTVVLEVCNIPPSFTVLDLRVFFSDFIENKKIQLFHFKKRRIRIQNASNSNVINDYKTETTNTYNCYTRMETKSPGRRMWKQIWHSCLRIFILFLLSND